jgi:hypothetical protein
MMEIIGPETTDMGMHVITDSTGEPSSWKVKHFADISGSEEFMQQLFTEIPELVEMTSIYGDDRKKLTEAILVISVEGLMPAFEHLKNIRASVGQQMPELNRRQLFENFEGRLWHAYKDLMQKAAKLMEPEIGFLFQKQDAQFEAGLLTLGGKQPKLAQAVAPYLRKQRSDWQEDLREFRNYLEHKDERDPGVFSSRYDAGHSEKLFESVWRAIADILAMLVGLHMSAGFTIAEIPPEERDSVRPRRFRLFRPGFPIAATP